MSHRELFVSQPNIFSGFQKPLKEADYVVFGVPFDVTSTYRNGARFGPNAIRLASLNIETYSFRTGGDVEDLRLHDLGDLHVSADVEKTLEKAELVTRDLLEAGKTPVMIGGEHTVTLGAMKGLGKKASKAVLVSFDAHLDVRNEFMDLKVSHTTFMRRINEQAKPAKILEVGTRAVCKEELTYAKKAGIDFVPAQQIRREGSEKTAQKIKQKIAAYDHVYVSVDMDFLDPAYAPAVQNPEADGLEPDHLLSILCGICDRRLVGFDVVEIAPNYDQGISAVQAAKVIFEILCCLEKPQKT
ncbi:MAG: agmatinase [Candidatus Bathyarchaeota archaeon]|nr:agmatinase [Candidatus Bathyarchaeota archaeon]